MQHIINRCPLMLSTTAAVLLLLAPGSVRADQFAGTATNYGKTQCIVLNRLPADSGARYSAKDSDQETKLCGIDFESKSIGLCPKIWSTSPGTIVYDIGQSRYNGDPGAFETEYCPRQRALKNKVNGVDRIAAFKESINGQFSERTSATYSQADLLYYHFSRYFNTTVTVPVAVARTMEAQEHLRRVTARGLATAPHGMILNGWNVVNSAERNPNGYSPVNELYYGDPKDGLSYGMMLRGQGDRCGAEFNGNIAGKGYSEQYVFMQQTPAFLALVSDKDFADAASSSLTQSKRDPVIARTITTGVSNEQMMFWMKELSEIYLLDYIFSQQDRPGNIDCQWVWYYVDRQGTLKSEKSDSKVGWLAMASIQVPDDIKGSAKVILIEKIHINDNDAGVRRYTNFTKKFALLEKIHHLSPVTYRQLVHLAKDFIGKGPIYNYVRGTFYLNPAYVDLIAQNTIQAAQILQNTCKTGTLKFDLDPENYLMIGKAENTHVDCTNP